MSNEHFNKMRENLTAMDNDPSTLSDRIEARDNATAEVYEALLASKEEGAELTPEEMTLADFAVDFVYRNGAEFHPDDILRHLEIDAGYRRHHQEESGEWVAETAEDRQAAVPYVQTVSKLSAADKTPAFKASRQGRPHEFLDNPDDVYNKYGELVTYLQR